MGVSFVPASAGGSGGGEQIITLPAIQVADGDYASKRFRVATGRKLTVKETGVETASGTLPGGLLTVIRNQTEETELFSEETTKATGDELASVTGPALVEFRSVNGSGAERTVVGHHIVQID